MTPRNSLTASSGCWILLPGSQHPDYRLAYARLGSHADFTSRASGSEVNVNDIVVIYFLIDFCGAFDQHRHAI